MRCTLALHCLSIQLGYSNAFICDLVAIFILKICHSSECGFVWAEETPARVQHRLRGLPTLRLLRRALPAGQRPHHNQRSRPCEVVGQQQLLFCLGLEFSVRGLIGSTDMLKLLAAATPPRWQTLSAARGVRAGTSRRRPTACPE